MYLPKHFAVDEPAPLHELIQANPLGLIITTEQGQVFADSVPFLLVKHADSTKLKCHVAKANPLWQRLQQNADVLVVFQGASCYVSPSYYPTKQEHGKVVPTWNYLMVQARGQARVFVDPTSLHEHVSANTTSHETRVGSDWQVTDAPAEYIDNLLKAIVGIDITVNQLQGKFKVSQNGGAADRDGVAQHLSKQADPDSKTIAQWVVRADQ